MSSSTKRSRFHFVKRARRGLSLLEVILAIAILGLSIVALGQLVRLGSQASVDAQNLNQAQVLCESLRSLKKAEHPLSQSP